MTEEDQSSEFRRPHDGRLSRSQFWWPELPFVGRSQAFERWEWYRLFVGNWDREEYLHRVVAILVEAPHSTRLLNVVSIRLTISEEYRLPLLPP